MLAATIATLAPLLSDFPPPDPDGELPDPDELASGIVTVRLF